MKILYHGPLYEGSTSLQRALALAQVPGVSTVHVDTGARPGQQPSLYTRIRSKLRRPNDYLGENDKLLSACQQERPDVVIVDNSKVISASVMSYIRKVGVKFLAYYTPDDILSRYNLSLPLRRSFPEWDIVFTTKSFHMDEMPSYGVRRVSVAGNAFDPAMHRPYTREDIGDEFEAFDCVFIGANEAERRHSINLLAKRGFSVVVYGAGRWDASTLHRGVTLRGSQFGPSYARCLHHGKIALGFLRKISRDRITTRSIEIAAAGRPMVAEKTDEHDAHFVDGVEYAGFSDDAELAEVVARLIDQPEARIALGAAGLRRCHDSGYSVVDRASHMVEVLKSLPNWSADRV